MTFPNIVSWRNFGDNGHFIGVFAFDSRFVYYSVSSEIVVQHPKDQAPHRLAEQALLAKAKYKT